MNPQKPKTKIEIKDAKKYKAIYCMTCRTGCRISERIWSMNVVLQSHGETLSLGIETLPVLLMNFQWSREQKWNQVRVSTVYIRTFQRTQQGLVAEDVLVQSCPERTNFGDLITADHNILSEESESRNNHRYAVVVQDLATQWLQSCPCKTKTSQETQKCLMKFLEPDRKPKVIYTDNSLEFGKACEDLSWNHCTSAPHRSETDGIAERAVRRVKEGTSAVLLQSGLDKEWSADSIECHCYLRNIQGLLFDGMTPYERRFGMPFDGPVIPFGALVEYRPISAKDMSRLHQCPKVLPGIFFGYILYAGGIWKGDIMIADIEELEEMDASELHARRLNAKEVSTPMKGDNFIFPVADGTVKTPGGDRRLKPSTLIRDRSEREEEQEVFRGESDGLSSPTLLQDGSTLDDAEAKNDFWSITGDFIYRHHLEP